MFYTWLIFLILVSSSAIAQAPLGIRAERPSTGRTIETKQGWMVPYTQTIPGCDVVFEMVPIPDDPFMPVSPWWLCSDPWLSIGFRIVRPLNEGTAEEWTKYWEPDSDQLKNDVEIYVQEGRGISGRPLMSPRIRKLVETKLESPKD